MKVYCATVDMDENFVYIARWFGDDLDGICGAGDTPLESIACLCACQEQNDTEQERERHYPFTNKQAAQHHMQPTRDWQGGKTEVETRG